MKKIKANIKGALHRQRDLGNSQTEIILNALAMH